MDEKPADRPRSYATVADLCALIDPRAVSWYCQDDVPILIVADPPPSIEALVEPAIKQRAIEAWRSACRLLESLDLWLNWFSQLRQKGDADPGLALWCAATAGRCIHALCLQEVHASPFDRETEESILKMLPGNPDWSMAGRHVDLHPETQQLVESERSSWQHNAAFLKAHYGQAGRLTTATELRGAVYQLRSTAWASLWLGVWLVRCGHRQLLGEWSLGMPLSGWPLPIALGVLVQRPLAGVVLWIIIAVTYSG